MAFVTSFLGASIASRPTNALRAQKCASKSGTVSMAFSASVPFLEKPPKLNGTLPGDVGFDPLGFSNMYDLNFLRESEVKHGRVCMLATLGWIFPEAVYRLPGEMHTAVNPLDAPGMVGWGPMLQILLFIAVIEGATWEKLYSGSAGGDYGFDPLNLAKSPAAKARMQLAEIKNGRLAMCAIGGAIHHSLITGQGMLEQINAGNFINTTHPLLTPF